ncbi:MAG: hypothetical protein GHCLOJNM_01383 [bacterium]|nr:hypothetical protein [bacterium]
MTECKDPALGVARAYHHATKHHFHRYARALGYLDWENQPNPFRTYAGAPRIPLPFMREDHSPPYRNLHARESVRPARVSLESVGQLFELSLAISAWKEFQGSRWALRVNPSSGNLHPTEGYLLMGPSHGCGEVPGFGAEGRVCHYVPLDHSLEVRTCFTAEIWRSLVSGLPEGAFLVGLTSIHWREAWKYGERAFRYCQHDVGHALAALAFSAAALGWKLVHLQDLSDSEIAALLGVDREDGVHPLEREHPDLLAAIIPHADPEALSSRLPSETIRHVASGAWFGVANRLSEDPVEWSIIEEVRRATEKPPTTSLALRVAPAPEAASPSPLAPLPHDSTAARDLILRRRSAVAYDGRTGISAPVFFRLLAETLPDRPDLGQRPCPWDAIRWGTWVHLALFVHLVEGILPGLYVLVRDPRKLDLLRASMRTDFIWERPTGCPTWLPLFHLLSGDARALAAQVSCHQDIAGYGAFSLGMVAEFEAGLEEMGPWFYRNLFWETGMIGQALYLGAEAAGIRATGIGCFFDDPVHEVFGLTGTGFQSLYHFTLGGAVEDTRLTTLPPYPPEIRHARGSGIA